MKKIMVTGGRGMRGHGLQQVVCDGPPAGFSSKFVDIEEAT